MAEILEMHDFGSIVALELDDGRMVNFDRRMFGHFLESLAGEQGVEEGGNVDLRGQWEYDGHALRRAEGVAS